MIEYIVCDKCGRKENVVGIEELAKQDEKCRLMISECLCSTCATWEQFIKNKSPNAEIIDGYAYIFNPYVLDISPGTILGQKGRKFRILRKDGIVKKSNDVWNIGKVPEHYRDQLPDTAWFITTKGYNILNALQGRLCNKKGCYDRYHCLVYDIVNEKVKYNSIPRDYIVGTERCGSFVNINKDIRNYNVCEPLIQSIFKVK